MLSKWTEHSDQLELRIWLVLIQQHGSREGVGGGGVGPNFRAPKINENQGFFFAKMWVLCPNFLDKDLFWLYNSHWGVGGGGCLFRPWTRTRLNTV